MPKQEVMIKSGSNKVFFFAHSFKTAYDHALDYIERNKKELTMKMYFLNESSYGERWRYQGTYGKK